MIANVARVCPIESYRQGDVLIFRDRTSKVSANRKSMPFRTPQPSTPVDIGDEARGIVARLGAVDRLRPRVDRAAVEAAIMAHLRALDLPEMPVRWMEDAERGYAAVLEKAESAAWSAAWSAARSAARSAAWSAARSAARSAAWSAAESAAWSAARSAARSAAESAAWSAARSAAWSAARSAAWSAAWSAARSAADRRVLDKIRGVWLPMADAYAAGLWLFWVCNDEVIAVPRPAIHVEGERLHRLDGPAVEWPNGTKYYFWRGLQVTEDIILRPDAITPTRIDGEHNAELRRVLLERYGVDRYMRESGAKEIHRDRFGVLLRKEMPGDEPIVMVQVVNSTPEPDGASKIYMLRVHPELRPMLDGGEFGEPQEMTAHAAVASTFGLRAEQYDPVMQT